jgi:hypothetical protein
MATFHIAEQSATRRAAKLSERRARTRFSWQGTAVMRILPDGPDVLGVVLDVSESGCGVEFGIGIPAQVGTSVEVDLNVRGAMMKKAGVIRYIEIIRKVERETRAGIEFIRSL